MAMLIVFIHHVAMLIQAPQVVAAVARDLDDAILRLFPEKIGESADDDEFGQELGAGQESRLGEHFVTVRSTSDGYIQAINGDGLLHWACQHDLVVRLRSRPGDFIATGAPLADVWAVGNPTDGERRLDEWIEPLNETILVGIRRTPRQDVECAIEELVEVAVRSLSPGINDPFTAMNCIDRLGASLGRFAERKLPSAHRGDKEGRLRIVARPVSFPALLDASFNQIRQYGCDSVAVTLRLLEALSSIAEHVQRAEDREAVRLHAAMVARMGESFGEEYDRHEVANRLQLIEESLDASVSPVVD
jgi:uncharacterized membrane protein